MANPGRGSTDVLRCHLDRMSDQRMKRAFVAVLDLDLDQAVTQHVARALRGPERPDLWKGLNSKPARQRD